MNTPLRFRCRNALHAMCAGFEFQFRENVVAGNPTDNFLVTTVLTFACGDDLNLPFGSLRLKTKGSDGGHNGLKDIQKMLGTAAYPRLRFGVGADYSKGQQVDFVLGKWNEEEAEALNERLERCYDLIKSFLFAGPKNTMNNFNNT